MMTASFESGSGARAAALRDSDIMCCPDSPGNCRGCRTRDGPGRTFARRDTYNFQSVNDAFGAHVVSSFTRFIRREHRGVLALATVAGLVGSVAAVAPGARAPGVSFSISSSTQVYAGSTPRGQDDEVMRGRGVALNNRSRIEFLVFTPAPQGVTTDDYLVARDSGKAFVEHVKEQRFTPANDMFGGPAVVALGRVMGGGRGGFGAGNPGGDAAGGGRAGGARGGFGGRGGGA